MLFECSYSEDLRHMQRETAGNNLNHLVGRVVVATWIGHLGNSDILCMDTHYHCSNLWVHQKFHTNIITNCKAE